MASRARPSPCRSRCSRSRMSRDDADTPSSPERRLSQSSTSATSTCSRRARGRCGKRGAIRGAASGRLRHPPGSAMIGSGGETFPQPTPPCRRFAMRWYLAAIVALAGLGLVVLLRTPAAAEADKAPAAGQMLSHDVYFTLKDKTPEARKKLVEACKKYLTNHPGS